MGIDAERTRPNTLRELIDCLEDNNPISNPDGVHYLLFSGAEVWKPGLRADGLLLSDKSRELINISLKYDEDRPLTESEKQAVDRLLSGEVSTAKDTGSLDSLTDVYAEDARRASDFLDRTQSHVDRMDNFLAEDHEDRLLTLARKKTRMLQHKTTAANYLSYSDISTKGLSQSAIEKLGKNLGRVVRGELTDSELAYAEVIDDFLANDSRGEKKKRLDDLANKIRSDLYKRMATLGLPLNPYSESLSWAYWDIAKQIHLSNHPELSTTEYHLGNPFQDSRVVEEIICRHLGWELHQKWRMPEFRVLIETAIAHKRHKQEIEALLNKEGKAENGTLSSHELMRLGEMVSAS